MRRLAALLGVLGVLGADSLLSQDTGYGLAMSARRGESRPPHSLVKAFTCIAKHEAPGPRGEIVWTANTGNGYYGGLQMDRGFQATWGKEFLRAWGTADHWPKEIQIAVAIRAYLQLGFQPWPTTSRICGLR